MSIRPMLSSITSIPPRARRKSLRAPATIRRAWAPTSFCPTKRAAFSAKPIPALRSTKCGGARSSPHGSPSCARNMRRNTRRRSGRSGRFKRLRHGRGCPGHPRGGAADDVHREVGGLGVGGGGETRRDGGGVEKQRTRERPPAPVLHE